MSSASRVLNRGLLLLCGLLLGVAGAAAILAGAPQGYTVGWLPVEPGAAAVAQARSAAADLPAVGGAPGALIVALSVAVLLTVLLVVFVCTRRSRRTATVLDLRSGDGHIRVDPNVADALLAGTLGERPDVLSARTAVYRVKGAPAISLVLTVRRGADLSRVLSAAEDALDEWDALAGVRVPVMVHLSDRSWLDGLRSAARVR
ncbi:hypothetical protein ACQEVI_22305 [Promicromonospora sp. CA-289599]|uniref:hypothetical protein n=1 Tax=Promicromonospora sp. CA-289599 TaxID=3240014 RepID=UPI003D91C8F3